MMETRDDAAERSLGAPLLPILAGAGPVASRSAQSGPILSPASPFARDRPAGNDELPNFALYVTM